MTKREKTDHHHHHHHHLALEIITEIISWVPAKHLTRFKCVSKSWYHLINDPKFIKLHLRRSLESANSGITTLILESCYPSKRKLYSFDLDFHHPHFHITQLRYPKTIMPCYYRNLVGSCNGLLCFYFFLPRAHPKIDFCFYNPATGACRKLPPINFNWETEFIELTWVMSFGYDSVSDDYKVFKFLDLRNSNRTLLFAQKAVVYSSRSDAWDVIPNPPWDPILFRTRTIVANNSFNWMKTKSKEIKCFDLLTLSYYEIPLPERFCSYSPILASLRGKLCMVTYYLDIWILDEYGHGDSESSWTRIFRHLPGPLNSPGITSGIWDQDLSFACVADDGRGRNIFLVVRKAKGLQKFLICCDLELEEARKIEMPDLPDELHLNTIQPWAGSLVPLCS